jgi:FAD-dependent oxidoreductase domain-containing protein 1
VPKPIVIIGGGALGSSTAYFLSQLDPGRQVVVIERDPTYATASSALSSSSLRQQFSTGVSIELSRFGYEFISGSPEVARQVSLMPRGYLFLGQSHQEQGLRRRTAFAQSYGVQILEHAPEDLKRKYPWMNVEDLAYAAEGAAGEGWFDGYSLMRLYQSRARASGVRFIHADASDFIIEKNAIKSIMLSNDTCIEPDRVVNAAGPWSGKLAAKMGVKIPVHAKRRCAFLVSCPTPIENFPILIDCSGVYIRPEQHHFILNVSPPHEEDLDDLPLDPDFSIFEDKMWPALAARIPAFESLRIERAWAGYYEFNTADHNGLVGQVGPDNFFVATGFSGHGLMHSPGVGRGMAELLTYGEYRSLDLSALSPERLQTGELIVEEAVY